MSDTALYERPASSAHRQTLLDRNNNTNNSNNNSLSGRSALSTSASGRGNANGRPGLGHGLGQGQGIFSGSKRTLSSLPYDVLLSIAGYLNTEDVGSMMQTCSTLHDFALTRSLWLSLASNLLRQCLPLPNEGFKGIADLDTPSLSQLVQLGSRLQHSWATREPRLTKCVRVFDVPEDEEIVWLSPNTSRYILCCTKTGKVLCYDVIEGKCVAQWVSGDDWEIWKCRVEFAKRVVYFAMARRVSHANNTDCLLLALKFPSEVDGELTEEPKFEEIRCFRLPGGLISIYLLDPLRRLLSAYVYISSTATIGLLVIIDWDNPSYTFINTGIRHTLMREWTCIGFDPANLVIHAEDKNDAFQCSYKHSLLESLSSPGSLLTEPKLVPPSQQSTLPFIHSHRAFAPYIPQSSHFVRQWWPTLNSHMNVAYRSCSIVLSSYTVPIPPEGHEGELEEDPALMGTNFPPGSTVFTIAQHYFSYPLQPDQLHWWYVREPFEIVCYSQAMLTPAPADGEDDGVIDDGAIVAVLNAEEDAAVAAGAGPEEVQAPIIDLELQELEDSFNSLPLIAVDFGCAVWLEYKAPGSDERRLRFVSFPGVDVDRASGDFDPLSSSVRTLETPPELDLRMVCHIGIDQAQCTVILGLSTGRIYVIRYE